MTDAGQDRIAVIRDALQNCGEISSSTDKDGRWGVRTTPEEAARAVDAALTAWEQTQDE